MLSPCMHTACVICNTVHVSLFKTQESASILPLLLLATTRLAVSMLPVKPQGQAFSPLCSCALLTAFGCINGQSFAAQAFLLCCSVRVLRSRLHGWHCLRLPHAQQLQRSSRHILLNWTTRRCHHPLQYKKMDAATHAMLLACYLQERCTAVCLGKHHCLRVLQGTCGWRCGWPAPCCHHNPWHLPA